MKPTPVKDKERDFSFFQYVTLELTHGYFMDTNNDRYTERRERVYTFLKQPREIEKEVYFTFGDSSKASSKLRAFNCQNKKLYFFHEWTTRYLLLAALHYLDTPVMMIYGMLLCTDVFLYVFTFLPLRIMFALFKLLTYPCCCLWRRSLLDPAQSCDLLKGIIFVSCVYFMSYIDTSIIYHLVRAQTLIKLYIIYNMLEVADRLFSSFGQDILDALFLTATESKKKRETFKLVLHLILAVIYVFMHATLVLFQATTLNVAFNSHNKVLLTVMMANNFVEIKGTVFKKFDKNNLFQISCSDIRERFHYLTLMMILLLRNMQQYFWNYEHFMELLPNMMYLLCSECVVDWFKHAFVLKFNHIPIESYQEYRATFAYDVAASRQTGSISNHSDVVSRRLGFIPLPLAVLIFHVTRISVELNGSTGVVVLLMGYLVLVLYKIFNSILIVGQACRFISEDVAQASCGKLASTQHLSVVDPFEQRGNKTILVSHVRPVEKDKDKDKDECGDTGDQSPRAKRQPDEQRSRTLEHLVTTPARQRSMRAPSVDHFVATDGGSAAHADEDANDSCYDRNLDTPTKSSPADGGGGSVKQRVANAPTVTGIDENTTV